jgi:hypothetical protein
LGGQYAGGWLLLLPPLLWHLNPLPNVALVLFRLLQLLMSFHVGIIFCQLDSQLSVVY